jgi:molybdopterin converting factor small subunit
MFNMIEIHLYGKLRRFASNKDATSESILLLSSSPDETIATLLSRIGIEEEETSNIFLNGTLSALSRSVKDGDRLGIFPNDMSLLYKWYFKKVRE